MVMSDFRPEVEIRPFAARASAMKNRQHNPYLWPNWQNFRVLYRKSESRKTIVTSDLRAKVVIWPFCACAMHPAIIIITVRSLWT